MLSPHRRRPAGGSDLITSGVRRLTSGNFTLREITPADSPLLYAWRMDPLSRAMMKNQEVVPLEVHERYLARYFDPANRDQWFMVEHDGQPIGSYALYDFSEAGDECEWGRLIVSPSLRGKGYGRVVCELMLQHARQTPLRRIRCDINVENRPTLHIHHALGFKEVGEITWDGRRFAHLVIELDERTA
jgi:RimJ/RimL family protein N-acetyltransferase